MMMRMSETVKVKFVTAADNCIVAAGPTKSHGLGKYL